MRNRRRKPKPVLALALVLSLGAFIWCALSWQKAERRERETRAWMHFVLDSLSETVNPHWDPFGSANRDTAYWKGKATVAQLQTLRLQRVLGEWVERRATVLDEAGLTQLRREGLVDPARQLRDSLLAHPELIPFESVLGGTMQFNPEGIVLLERPYVFSDAEDGHVGGHLLLRYTVLPGPRIVWKRLWAKPD